MPSSVLQPQTMKRRLQSVVRRSLSKIRHEPPPVPPKDDSSRSSPSASTHSRSLSQPTTISTHQQQQNQAHHRSTRSEIPPHYYHNYTQTECDGRHYEPSAPISPDQPVSSYDYDAERGQRYYGHDEAAQYDLAAPHPSVNERSATGPWSGDGGGGLLSLNTKDHGSPLIPRQELMVLSNPNPTVSETTTKDDAIGVARSSSSVQRQGEQEQQEAAGLETSPVYGQSYGDGTQGYPIESAFGLDPLMEEEWDERMKNDEETNPGPMSMQLQQTDQPLYELDRKEVPTMTNGVGDDQWGEHAWDFQEFRAALNDDDGRDDIGKALSTEEKNDAWSVPSSSKKESDDEIAYHHVAVPDEELGRGKGKEEYIFPRTVPEDTVDSTVEEAPAVVHETVQPEVHEIVQKEVHRDIHHYEEHYRIQPVVELEVLPTRHIFIDAEGNASELHFEGGKPPPGFESGQPVRQYITE